MMYKKANTFANAMLGLLVLGVFVIGGFWMYTSNAQQTFVEEKTGVVTSQSGKLAYVKLYAEDREANDQHTKVNALPLYCQITDSANPSSKGVFIADALSSSSSDFVSAQAGVGDSVKCTGFNSSYYGDEVTGTITSEDGIKLYIPVHKIIGSGGGKITIYDTRSASNTIANVTSAGAGLTGYVDYFKVEINSSNNAFNFAGVYLDTVASGSNISAIEIQKGDAELKSSSRLIQSARDTANYVFELDTPIMLHEGDVFQSGKLRVTADGDGCTPSGSTNESLVLYAFDKGQARSTKANGGIISDVVEDDALSPSDVGATAFASSTFYCVSGTA